MIRFIIIPIYNKLDFKENYIYFHTVIVVDHKRAKGFFELSMYPAYLNFEFF